MALNQALTEKCLVGIVACNSVHYITMAFNALEAGKIIVPLRDRNDRERIESTGLSDVLEPSLESSAGTGWFEPKYTYTAKGNQDIAQISFTSGTEGAPKGVILSHRALWDTVDRLLSTSAVDYTIREYVGVPVYHSFGYGRCRLIAHVGGRAYLPEQGFDPREIAKMLAEGEINALSAVPSMLRVLLDSRQLFTHGRELMKWIEIGSQPMGAQEKLQLRELFPEACIVQHYGLTEASRTTLLKINTASPQQLESVGKAYGDTRLSINKAGKICIKGPHLASGLLVDGKLEDMCGPDGWFETSDLGCIKDGYLYFLGRADNRINCAGQKISSELIEERLRERFNISAGVCVSPLPDSMYGDVVLLAKDSMCTVPIGQLKQGASSILAENGITGKNVVHVVECQQFPMTETGKIKRNTLVEMYLANSEEKESGGAATPDTRLEKLLSVYQEKLGVEETVTESDSLETLGLDSLAAVGISMQIEKVIGGIPHEWRSMSIAELAESRISNADKTQAEPGTLSSLPIKGATNNNPGDIGFWKLVKEDFITHESDWGSQGFWAVFNHRFGNWRMGQPKILRMPLTLLYRFHRKLIQIFCGIKLDYTVRLGRRVKLEHFGGMMLGAKSIGNDVTIRQNTTFGIKNLSNLQSKPTIEDGVNIGAGAVIVGDVVVGRYSVIGPNCVVEEDVPPFSIVSAPSAIVIPIKSD